FDNLQISQLRGPLMEETHYYPFGLTMAGISSKAAGKLENKFKYNGIEHNSDWDVNTDDAFFRTLDPAIGRWWQVDPKIEMGQESWTPYNSMMNNPIRYQDPKGDCVPCLVLEGIGEAVSIGYRAYRAAKGIEAISNAVSQANAPKTVMTEMIITTDAMGNTVAVPSSRLVSYSIGQEKIQNTMASEKVSELKGEIKSLENGIKSNEKQIKTHREKLNEYKSDPEKGDNKGKLEGKTPEQQQKVIDGRINRLEKTIEKHQREIQKKEAQINEKKAEISKIQTKEN
ncbi:MAG: hypothetical protein K2Q21_13495, partial [Chitinophagaceae bacterium]|nr:hypothetical protein [Chitinophagaceae bacterium]